MNQLQETIALLNEDRGHWGKTAEATGLGRPWLAKLARGKIEDPGFNKVQTLHSYLSRKYPDGVPEREAVAQA